MLGALKQDAGELPADLFLALPSVSTWLQAHIVISLLEKRTNTSEPGDQETGQKCLKFRSQKFRLTLFTCFFLNLIPLQGKEPAVHTSPQTNSWSVLCVALNKIVSDLK